jgi:integrase
LPRPNSSARRSSGLWPVRQRSFERSGTGYGASPLRNTGSVALTCRLALGPAYREQELVFADATGETLHPNGGLRSTWVKITQSAGLPGLRFHDLRHAHASLMLAQGTHPKVVSERLGHATVGITLDIYSHVLPGLQREAAERLDELLAVK